MTLPTLFWADLTLVVLFFLALPIYYARIQSNTMAALARGERSRGREYAEILAVLWMATAALGAIWIFLGRSPAALGLGGSSAGGAGAWLGWGLTALGTAYFAYCAKAVVSNEDAVEQIRRDTRDLKELLPHDRRELAGFSVVGLSAGICEELLYRGFLFWWLSEALGWGIASGAVVSSLAFGYAHMYQGWRGMVKTSAAGAIFLAVFLLTGSIWPAVWLHALGDLVAGWLAYHAYGKLGQTPGSGADGAPKSATGMAPEAADMLDSSSVPSAR